MRLSVKFCQMLLPCHICKYSKYKPASHHPLSLDLQCLTSFRHPWLRIPQTYVSFFTSCARVDRISLGVTKQVRALASPTNDLILSASRDSTAILWQKPNSSAPFEQERIFKPGSGYVNAVTIVPPTLDAPKGALFLPLRSRLVEIFATEDRGGGEDSYAFLIDLGCF